MAVSPLPGGQWPPGWHGRYMFSIGRFSETKNLMRVRTQFINSSRCIFERCPQRTTKARCCWWDCYIQISFTCIILGKRMFRAFGGTHSLLFTTIWGDLFQIMHFMTIHHPQRFPGCWESLCRICRYLVETTTWSYGTPPIWIIHLPIYIPSLKLIYV